MRNFFGSKYQQFLDLVRSKYSEKLQPELEFLEENWNHPVFDFSVYLSKRTLFSRVAGRLFKLVFQIARYTGWINFRVLPFKILARSSDVKSAFEDNVNFKVPFGPEMQAIAGPETFGLGLDNDEHKMQRAVMEMYMRHDREVFGADSWAALGKSAEYILNDSGGRIDLMSEYAVPLISEACLKRFGLDCPDPLAFAQWNIAVSIQLFASPTGTTKLKLQQLAAASRNIRNCIEHSMHSENPPSKDSLLGYLLNLRKQERFPDVANNEVSALLEKTSPSAYLSDDRIRAIVAGMVSGFVPTTSLGSGNLLQALGDHPEWTEQLSKAAASNDKLAVRNIILEAARFKPAGDPGHFRIVATNFSFSREGKGDYEFKQGDLVMLSTPQAMMDPHARENPKEFQPGRKANPDYMFGHTHHSCLGMQMASEVMTELFLKLFSQADVELTANKYVEQAGPFPWKHQVTFKPGTPVEQSMVTVGIPFSEEKREKIEAILGGPEFQGGLQQSGEEAEFCAANQSEVAKIFHNIESIHNASVCVVELTRKGKPAPTLLLEFNIDGNADDVFNAIDKQCPTAFRQLMDLLGKGASTPLSTFLNKHLAKLLQRPWGNIGLGFNGIGDYPSRQIRQEHELYNLLEPVVQRVASQPGQGGDSAYQLLQDLRAFMLGTEESPGDFRSKLKNLTSDEEYQELNEKLEHLKGLGSMLHRPARRVPKIAAHTDKSFFQALADYASLPKVRLLLSSVVWIPMLIALVYSVIAHSSIWKILASTVVLTGALAVVFVLLIAGIFAFLVFKLTNKEKSDAVDESLVKPDSVQRIQDYENQPAFIQSQLTAVNTLKKGRFRLALLSLGLLVIKLEVLHWFRSGFVVDIGTIRQAKWFRLAGTDQLIFQANFDGSWESYLEDFSNKAFQGQNAVWSHCEGYPRTRFMMLDGADDGDNFKRWVRSKQIRTNFWYSRFPNLSNAHIRRNAMIRDGLARVNTASEARAWLSYFGSQPATGSRIEDAEVQSLVFNSNKRLQYSACIGLRFKGVESGIDERQSRKRFLQAILNGVVSSAAGNGESPDSGLPPLAFGDQIHADSALYIAFSYHGLHCLGLQDSDQNFGLSSFSPAFVNGMANRYNILGDTGRQHPEHWQWFDHAKRPGQAEDNPVANDRHVDVMLFPMAHSAKGLAHSIDSLASVWADCAQEVVHIRTGKPEVGGEDYNAAKILGFRDGISQPVIKGTYRHTSSPVPEHDAMDPGEIILGYRDNKKYFPLTPKVESTQDLGNRLADMPQADPGLFVPFGNKATEPRDLGRNGTYLVLRQIELDASGFEEQIGYQSEKTGLPEETVKAKIMGRWPSGAPLVRYPTTDPHAGKKYSDVPAHELNDFLYGGNEDPQGNRCPLGSHIRRANPRDSLGPIRETELKISNRHRVLRRGRKYHKVWFNGDESQVQQADDGRGVQNESGQNGADGSVRIESNSEGLLFVAMNANLERQFEFVQQTWIAGQSFHGLNDKADPLLGTGEPDQFSIPTPNGTVTLSNLQSYSRVRGGGYYFMPSLSFLRYLASLPG